jgi:hypothetical protein
VLKSRVQEMQMKLLNQFEIPLISVELVFFAQDSEVRNCMADTMIV